MLTSHVTEEELNASFCAGASAYVIKDINTEFLMNVIKMVKRVKYLNKINKLKDRK